MQREETRSGTQEFSSAAIDPFYFHPTQLSASSPSTVWQGLHSALCFVSPQLSFFATTSVFCENNFSSKNGMLSEKPCLPSKSSRRDSNLGKEFCLFIIILASINLIF